MRKPENITVPDVVMKIDVVRKNEANHKHRADCSVFILRLYKRNNTGGKERNNHAY